MDGLTDGLKAQYVLNYLLTIKKEGMENIFLSQQFIEEKMPFLSSQVTDSYEVAEQRMYSGLSIMVVEGLDQIIIVDTRSYPLRSVQEPEKEKSLRGAKDGFTESFLLIFRPLIK